VHWPPASLWVLHRPYPPSIPAIDRLDDDHSVGSSYLTVANTDFSPLLVNADWLTVLACPVERESNDILVHTAPSRETAKPVSAAVHPVATIAHKGSAVGPLPVLTAVSRSKPQLFTLVVPNRSHQTQGTSGLENAYPSTSGM